MDRSLYAVMALAMFCAVLVAAEQHARRQCADDETSDSCAARAGVDVDTSMEETEENPALNLLQRKGMLLQAQAEELALEHDQELESIILENQDEESMDDAELEAMDAFFRDDEETEAPDPTEITENGRRLPFVQHGRDATKYGIDVNSSHHGNGTIYRSFQSMVFQCGALGSAQECIAATGRESMAVFDYMCRKMGTRFTDAEKTEYRTRFVANLKKDSRRLLLVKADLSKYKDWKRAVFNIYKMMQPVVSHALAEEVANAPYLHWTPNVSQPAAKVSLGAAFKMMGLEMNRTEALTMLHETRRREAEDLLELGDTAALPQYYDVRTAHPDCKDITEHVRFQDCNNCWSHASALVAESRICLAGHGSLRGPDAWLSQSYIAACRQELDGRGYCQGAPGTQGFLVINKAGVPTGGPNKRGNAMPGINTCVPQFLPHLSGVSCPSSCTDHAYQRELDRDLFYPKFAPRGIAPFGSQAIWMAKNAIYNDGPLLIGFRIYRDFYAYHSGIYKPLKSKSNKFMGGHAVVGMGFGPDYFGCVNSWGTHWGWHGAFRVANSAIDVAFFLPGRVTGDQWPLPVP